MSDELVAKVAGNQFNRISWAQLLSLGLSRSAIEHRVATGRFVVVEAGVFAVAPVLPHDPWGRWMGATLTHPGSALCRLSAAVAYAVLSFEGPFTTIVRPGTGGPRRQRKVLTFRSNKLAGDVTALDGIPITTMPRTLVDIAGDVSEPALARAVREAVRLEHTSLHQLGDALGRYRGWRGVRSLASVVARYSGLPIERARSGAEVKAMELLKEANAPLPRLNEKVAGEEADLSWPDWRGILEIDGEPFHRDVGADARKERAWREAGWNIKRVSSDDVYERPWLLIERARALSVQLRPS